jgi:xanthine dehydrogenase accessory factor
MISPELERTASALAAARRAFVVATVVRAQRPTSAQPGDAAIIHPDGRIDGFVGGACASSTVRLHALHVLETHEPLLLRIRPGTEEEQDPVGMVTVSNPCLSGGELEIFLEPRLPPARIRVMGDSPIAEAMHRIGDSLGYDVQRGGTIDGDDTAVIVASHGQGDEEASVAAALRAGVPYVGLVASPKRGAATLNWLREDGFSPEDLSALHVPAGLDIGSRTHSEIALSIYAQLVSLRIEVSAGQLGDASDPRESVAAAVDPVCGMIEPPGAAWSRIVHDGRELAFCCSGCRGAFQADPARYALPH